MNKTSEQHPVARVFGIVLPVLVLISAIGVSLYLLHTKPRPQIRAPQERAAMVETLRVARTNMAVRVKAAGTVIPATAITLRPEVAGRVTALDSTLEPGGVFQKGDVLVKIAARDYELQCALRRAELATVEAAYRLELGRQDVAQHEWGLLPDNEKASDLDRELALRRPQLKQAEAAVEGARAALALAELNVERTQVRAPFNGVVRSREINVGAQVTTQSALAQIANSDVFWVLVTVPITDLNWIEFPSGPQSHGSLVEVVEAGGNGSDATWSGVIVSRLPELESAGRLAQLIVAVADPLADSAKPLLLGSYVDATIVGKAAHDIVRVPRGACREGDVVWLRNGEGRLAFRSVDVLWGDHDEVYVRNGLDDGEALVVSDLGTPVEGMKLVLPDGQKDDVTSKTPTDAGRGEPGARP